MVKILFVDDEPDIELLTKQKFRKQLANGDFELLFARNGHEALNLIEKESYIAVVVSDINMPEMDGLTLLDKLKVLSPATKTIVVSAYGDTNTLRSAMNKGVFDFVTKPVDFKELGDAIMRSLAQYESPSTSLYTYQRFLGTTFPEGINLSDGERKNTILWDAFNLNPQNILVLGISALPSPFPLEIAISSAHGLLRSTLHENPDFSLTAFDEKLSTINSSFKAQALVGQYYLGSHMFSYKTNGDFKAQYRTAQGESSLTPLQTVHLHGGDVIMMKHPSSTSHLSLIRIQEN